MVPDFVVLRHHNQEMKSLVGVSSLTSSYAQNTTYPSQGSAEKLHEEIQVRQEQLQGRPLEDMAKNVAGA